MSHSYFPQQTKKQQTKHKFRHKNKHKTWPYRITRNIPISKRTKQRKYHSAPRSRPIRNKCASSAEEHKTNHHHTYHIPPHRGEPGGWNKPLSGSREAAASAAERPPEEPAAAPGPIRCFGRRRMEERRVMDVSGGDAAGKRGKVAHSQHTAITKCRRPPRFYPKTAGASDSGVPTGFCSRARGLL